MKPSLSKFLSNIPQTNLQASTTPAYSSARIRKLREQSSRNTSDTALSASNGHINDGALLNDNKDGGTLDWYTEGPRRKVQYDDLTAIDWIFEYTKERQRLRILYSKATGLLGYAQQLLDASQIWLVLIATGIASGVLAAGIDVASDWLGDLKTGYCKSGDGGGRFYLNKGFCCWGHEGMRLNVQHDRHLAKSVDWSQCLDWTPWSTALHLRSAAGRYTVEYAFFIAFSVSYVTYHILYIFSNCCYRPSLQ